MRRDQKKIKELDQLIIINRKAKMNGNSDGKSRWICPNDRELTLRAK